MEKILEEKNETDCLLNVSYKRGMEHNYMVIKCNEPSPDDYQINMLVNNNINNILKLSLKNSNGYIDFCYEISSLQPIKRLFENKEIDSAKLIDLLNGIIQAFHSIHDYLLDENNVIIDPQYIYMNVETHEIKLLIYPYYKGYFRNGFLSLAEYILERVDHQDSKAVMIAYNLFKIMRTDSFTVKNIEEVVASVYTNEQDIEISKKDEPSQGNSFVPDNSMDLWNNEEDNLFENATLDSEIMPEKKGDNKSKKGFTLGKLFPFAKKQTSNSKENDIFGAASLKEDDFDFHPSYASDNSFYENDTSTFNEDSSDNEFGKTTLLMPEEPNSSFKHVLVSKDNVHKKDFEINKFPVVIGKIADSVDFVIRDASISRMHATIYEEDGTVFLKDIGSTNGTYLNSLMLESEKPIRLEPGDIIRFGKVNFEYK